MKILNYLNNIFRLGKLKLKGSYIGSVLQGIPISTTIYVSSGTLSISGKLNCRNGCYISAGTGYLEIGKECFFNQGLNLVSKERIVLGEKTIIGPNVIIVDHDHDYHSEDRQHQFTSAPINIGDNVWIGANVVILKGTNIGAGSVIAAGTVVKGIIPENSLVYQERSLKIKKIGSKEND